MKHFRSRESGINLVAYQNTVHFSSSDPAAKLPADYTFAFSDAGVHTFVMNLEHFRNADDHGQRYTVS